MPIAMIRHQRGTSTLALGIALAGCLAIGQATGLAEGAALRLDQSVESTGHMAPAKPLQGLVNAPLQEHLPLSLEGERADTLAGKASLAAADIRQFWIYDARTELAGDEDHDGFFYRLRLTFDADVDIGGADVYAMLYLSYEEGPWNHYYTTDVFYILEDSFDDDYEVVTQLLEGYPTGYYDLLIELYDADLDVLVATYGPYEDVALDNIPLEDQWRDIPDDPGGGGGIGWLGLSLLGALWGTRLRSRATRMI